MPMRARSALTLVLVPVSLLTLLVAVGCERRRSTPAGPTPVIGGGTTATVVLTVNPTTIAPGESATITVVAQSDGGAPLPGRPVLLSTTLGTLSQPDGTTDETGRFTATLRTRPTDTGTATVTATVEGVSATATVTLETAPPLAISPSTATLAAGASQEFAATRGTPPYTWSAGGGTVSPTTGPTTTYTAGSTPGTFTVIVRDAAGAVASASVTIAGAPALAISPSTATLAMGASQTFIASGGVPPYTWVAGGGTVSPVIGPTTLYTAGSTPGTFTVAVRDATGAVASASVTIAGAPALAISPSAVTLPPGASQGFAASGGTPPYTWVAGGGTVSPAIGPTTTYTAGSAPGTFAVTVRDAAGAAASATVTIAIP